MGNALETPTPTTSLESTAVSRLSFPATGPPDPGRVLRRVLEGFSEGVSEGFFEGF